MSHLVGHWVSYGCGRSARKEGIGSGQQKAPRGYLGGEWRRSGRLSAVACKGTKGHQEHEESAEEKIPKGAKEVGHST